MSIVVGLTEYLGKDPPDIFLYDIYAKIVHAYDEIHKAVYIIICALVRVLLRWIFYTCSLLYHHWSSFCIKEEDKKGVFSVFGRYHCKIKVKDDFLHIEAYAFFDIKYIYQIWYYSEIFSGIQTTFEHGNEKYSFFSCKFHLSPSVEWGMR